MLAVVPPGLEAAVKDRRLPYRLGAEPPAAETEAVLADASYRTAAGRVAAEMRALPSAAEVLDGLTDQVGQTG